MSGSLRGRVDHPGSRLKRSRAQPRAPVRPAGRSPGCAVTAESGTESDRPTTWASLATFRSEGRGAPSAPSLTPCVTRDPCENAAVPCSRADLTDRSSWLGLLEPGGGTVCRRAGRRTQRDLRPPTRQGSPPETGLTTAWSAERPSA